MISIYNKKGRVNNTAIPIIISVAVILLALIIVVIVLVSSNKKLGKSLNKVEYAEYVYKYSSEFSIDPNLVFAIIKTESNFDTNAESHAGAKGLMQLMPDTFSWLQEYTDGEVQFSDDDLFNPDINIKYGCIFLQFLTEKYEVESTAIAAYNAGFGNVDNWLDDRNYSSDGATLSYIPYSETAIYVEKVQNAKRYYQNNITEPTGYIAVEESPTNETEFETEEQTEEYLYTDGENSEPSDNEYNDNEFNNDEYSDDEHNEDEHNDDEYSENEYSDDEYSENEYSDDEYSNDEYY